MKKSPYYHLEINSCSRAEAHNALTQALSGTAEELSTVYFLNAHCFNESLKDQKYCEALSKATYLFNDGIGITIGGKLKGIHFPDNLNGTDLIPQLLQISETQKKRIYLLGGSPEVVETAANNFKARCPGLNICGYHDGFFADSQAIVEDIVGKQTDLLIVGMGVPKQEKWLHDNREKLTGVRVAVAGGAIFDFTAEKFKRAPVWIQKIGMEWAFRLAQEPRRLFKRYIVGNVTFLYHVISAR